MLLVTNGCQRVNGLTLSYHSCVFVVLAQAIDHGIERDDARRCQHTGLPHAAAQQLPAASRLIDELF